MPFGFFKKKTKEPPKPTSLRLVQEDEESDKYKIVFLGGIYPGKSQIVNRLLGRDFDPHIGSTVGFVSNLFFSTG